MLGKRRTIRNVTHSGFKLGRHRKNRVNPNDIFDPFPLSFTLSWMDTSIFRLMPALADVLEGIRDGDATTASLAINAYINALKTCSATLEKLPGTKFTNTEKEELYRTMLERYEKKWYFMV